MISRIALLLGLLSGIDAALAAPPPCSLYRAAGFNGANVSTELPQPNAGKGAEA